MRDIYATTMQLVHVGGGDAFQVACDRAMAWAWRIEDPRPNLSEQPAGTLPKQASPEATTVDWWSVTEGPARALELRLRHPDDKEESLRWLATITISDISGTTRATVRLERGASVHALRPWRLELRAPTIVLDLMRPPLMAYAGTLELAPGARVLRSREIDGFVGDVLRADGRALPILIASRRVQPDVVELLARALGGLVQVVRLGSQEAESTLGTALRESGYTVPSGGLRLYWPGFGQDGQPPRHPYWTASQIHHGHEPGQAVIKHLVNLLAPISTGRVPSDPGVMLARREWLRAGLIEQRKREEARRDRARRERQRLAEAVKSAQSGRDAGKKAERLKVQLTEIQQELAAAEEERDAALKQAESVADNELKVIEESLGIEERAAASSARVAELESENAALRESFKTIATYQPDVGNEESGDVDAAPEEASSWDEVSQHLPELAGPGFALTSQAEECAADGNRYPNPSAMWKALRALERVGRSYNEQGASVGMRFEEFASREGGLDVALQDSSYREECFFEFDGHECSRLPHVKIDDAKPPHEVGRIYFALDPEHKRLIVDWFGTKPDRPKTRSVGGGVP